MAHQRDFKFTFEDGATAEVQAKFKWQALMDLATLVPDRTGQTASMSANPPYSAGTTVITVRDRHDG